MQATYATGETVKVKLTGETGTVTSHTNPVVGNVFYTVDHHDGTSYRYAEAELTATDLTSEQFTKILRAEYPDHDVQLWHTGGGTMNPVVVLKTGRLETLGAFGKTHIQDDAALLYIMISHGWGPSEASFGVYDERLENGYEEAVHDWWGSGDEVPTAPADIKALIDAECAEWIS